MSLRIIELEEMGAGANSKPSCVKWKLPKYMHIEGPCVRRVEIYLKSVDLEGYQHG